MSWDPTWIKSQLRNTATRLGQLQDRFDSQSPITKRDIATLLGQGNIVLARAKAQKLIKDELRSDLLQVLENYLGVILSHFNELEKNLNPSPVLVEAASSIIYAGLQVEVKELHAIREILIQRLGPDFARSAIGNRDHYVSRKVVRALSSPPPSAARLDDFLSVIATVHGVDWTPDLRPHEKLTALSEILDHQASPVVDLPLLRKLCAHGLPDQPNWLRPRIWRLLLGLLPVVKNTWAADARKQRASYYDLVRRLLEPFANSPSPTSPLSSSDATLVDVAKQLSRVPPNLYNQLEEEPEPSDLCPLNEGAPDEIRLVSAENLDTRLRMLNGKSKPESDSTPEIRLESDEPKTPSISVTAPESLSSRRPSAPTTLLPSQSYGTGVASRKHMSALLRLLYIHSCLNPANHSPHMASLLIPLYSVLNTEIEADDLAHAEADAFWLFEAIVGEFSELEDEEGGNVWMKKLGERLAWADPDLSADLQTKGLDPSLPHYSYRWLAPLLTHTLPLTSVWMTWDVLFSRPMRERDSNPKLDGLLDICTSMLIRARAPLFRLGKPGQRSPGLWGEDNTTMPPPSPTRAWELSDAFLEGMSLLQLYPIEAAGGIDRILQTAADLTQRREAETRVPQADNSTLTARIKDTVWRGITNQVSSTPSSPALSAVDDGNESIAESSVYNDGESDQGQQSTGSGFTSRLASAVWSVTKKGTGEQSSPNRLSLPAAPSLRAQSLTPVPPSPLSLAPITLAQEQQPVLAPATANLWSYAEKLRDSDAAATLAKASTNWRVKAFDAWSSRSSGSSLKSPPTSPPPAGKMDLTNPLRTLRRESLASESSQPSPLLDVPSGYTPPERPAFFRNPRDSLYIDPRHLSTPSSPNPSSPDLSPMSDTGSAISSGSRTKRGGPKPLLLGSSISSSSSIPTMTPERNQWPEIMRRSPMQRDSMSSASSISPSTGDFMRTSRRAESRDWDSDTTRSRIVPLKRGSISPNAAAARLMSSRTQSVSSAASSDHGGHPASVPEEAEEQTTTRGSDSVGSSVQGRLPSPDSPITLPSSPPPRTPPASISLTNQAVRVSNAERQRGSLVLSEASDVTEDLTKPQPFIRRKTPSPTPPNRGDGEASDSSTGGFPRASLRRQPPRLLIRDDTITKERLRSSPNTLAPPSHEVESITTPKASSFDVVFPSPVSVSPRSPRRARKTSAETSGDFRTRKLSSESRETRVRKVSADGSVGEPARKVSGDGRSLRKVSDVRTRKISGSSGGSRRNRDSAAMEGDDEGYDELLSAYESG